MCENESICRHHRTLLRWFLEWSCTRRQHCLKLFPYYQKQIERQRKSCYRCRRGLILFRLCWFGQINIIRDRVDGVCRPFHVT